jgi:hypothetical protein
MKVCQLRKSLLRQATFRAQLTQPSAELDSRIVSGWHASSLVAAHYESTHDECDMLGPYKHVHSRKSWICRKFAVVRMDLVNGITAGVLRLGISQGGYVAYVEVAQSGAGFQYFVTRDGVPILEGSAPDFESAKQKAEQELRFLCSASIQ